MCRLMIHLSHETPMVDPVAGCADGLCRHVPWRRAAMRHPGSQRDPRLVTIDAAGGALSTRPALALGRWPTVRAEVLVQPLLEGSLFAAGSDLSLGYSASYEPPTVLTDHHMFAFEALPDPDVMTDAAPRPAGPIRWPLHGMADPCVCGASCQRQQTQKNGHFAHADTITRDCTLYSGSETYLLSSPPLLALAYTVTLSGR
jgi:hypothetical protein